MKDQHWTWVKSLLLFFGLLCKSLAFSDPLPIHAGVLLKAISGIVWVAFDGSLLWLLKPPFSIEENTDETKTISTAN